MNHISLFSGIGGFDLAAEWMGWNNIANCEINPFCRRILNYYWPNSISYADIKTTDFSIHRGQIDIVTGGDPCQRNSNANRSGDEVAESLGGEFIRAITQIMPRWVVRENPATIRKDAPWPAWRFAKSLESIGYVVPNPLKLRVCCTGGRIRRERLFVLGYLPGAMHERLQRDECQEMERTRSWRQNPNIAGPDWRHTDAEILSKFNGIPSELDGITFPKWKTESIKAYGNSVSPQVAYQIFQTIQKYENI